MLYYWGNSLVSSLAPLCRLWCKNNVKIVEMLDSLVFAQSPFKEHFRSIGIIGKTIR